MLIVNKDFHDYYDSAMIYGIDKAIVYDRSRRTIREKSHQTWLQQFTGKKRNHIYTFRRHVIGFTGNIYPFIEAHEKKYDAGERTLLYKRSDFERYWSEKKIELHNWALNNYRMHYRTDEWLNLVPIFVNHKCPAFIRHSNGEIIANPCLKDYEFYRIVPPPQAFTEIEQYMSGVLGDRKDADVSISDADKLKQRGFDKWSFKRQSSKKNRKKKRRNH